MIFQDVNRCLAVDIAVRTLLWMFVGFHSVEGDRRSSGKKTLSVLRTTMKLYLALEILELKVLFEELLVLVSTLFEDH